MDRNLQMLDDSWESDAVWDLLDKVPPVLASQRFAEKVTRAARLEPAATVSIWKRFFAPIPIVGLATAMTATALAFLFITAQYRNEQFITMPIVHVQTSHYADDEILEVAETELLRTADDLEQFSDAELVGMIGL